jgi:magnesium transporter|tara:strand:- start:290 stop:1240 length:951 start_codon:yes stop_codon:yes gene_type:complete
MIRIFHLPNYQQQKVSNISEAVNLESAIWIDLQEPTKDEITQIEEFYNIKFPTRQQQEEIEISSRYLEDNNIIKINSTFLNIIPRSNKIEEHEFSFIVTSKHLFSLRYSDSRVMVEAVKKIKQFPIIYSNPARLFISIFESRIDFDADLIESASRYISEINKSINYSENLDEETIHKISKCQQLTMSIREGLFDKQRVITALHRNEDLMIENYHRLRIMIKDISSLIEHTNFNFTRLEYLQNSFLGLINLQQNKAIKVFTVASLTFMPPTLIASAYGMNFKFMPELHFTFGYPIAIGLMALSSLLTILIFKRKKWL